MSKISREGFEQIQIIKNALDSMFDKLDKVVYTKVKPTKNDSKKVKDIEKLYTSHNVFGDVKDEFEAIAGIVEMSKSWEEVK